MLPVRYCTSFIINNFVTLLRTSFIEKADKIRMKGNADKEKNDQYKLNRKQMESILNACFIPNALLKRSL